MKNDRHFIRWNGGARCPAPKINGTSWARSCEVGTNWNQVQTNKQINSIRE